MFSVTRGSALSSWSPACNYFTAVNHQAFQTFYKKECEILPRSSMLCMHCTGLRFLQHRLCQIASCISSKFEHMSSPKGRIFVTPSGPLSPPPLPVGSSISTGDSKAQRVSPALPLGMGKNILISPSSPSKALWQAFPCSFLYLQLVGVSVEALEERPKLMDS